MKSLIIISLFALFSASIFLTSCLESKAGTEDTSQVVIPTLLERNKKIGSESEQAYMLEAYTKLKTRIETKPEEMEPFIKMAQVFMVEARATGEHGYYYPAALSMIQHVLDNKNENENKNVRVKDFTFQALSLKASVYLSLHEFDKALVIAKEAAAISPYNAQIHGALVDAYVELGNYPAAIEMSDKMVSIRPDLRSYSRISYLREIHGEVKGSIEAMKMAIKAALPGSEESAWCHYTIGQLYETYGEPGEAEKAYQAILAQRADYPFAIAALGGIAANKKEYKKAMELLDQACEIIPEVGFYEQKAAIYQELGETSKLNKAIDEILEMLADDEAHGHKMGLAYAEVYLNLAHDYKRALKYAKTEYDARPENIDVNKLMALVHLKLNKTDEAAEYLKVARKTGSKHPELDYIEAVILAKKGEVAKARKMIRTAQMLNPNVAFALQAEIDKVMG